MLDNHYNTLPSIPQGGEVNPAMTPNGTIDLSLSPFISQPSVEELDPGIPPSADELDLRNCMRTMHVPQTAIECIITKCHKNGDYSFVTNMYAIRDALPDPSGPLVIASPAPDPDLDALPDPSGPLVIAPPAPAPAPDLGVTPSPTVRASHPPFPPSRCPTGCASYLGHGVGISSSPRDDSSVGTPSPSDTDSDLGDPGTGGGFAMAKKKPGQTKREHAYANISKWSKLPAVVSQVRSACAARGFGLACLYRPLACLLDAGSNMYVCDQKNPQTQLVLK